MKLMKMFLGAAAAALFIAQAPMLAHEVQHAGKVLMVAPAKIEIASMNKTTKKEETVPFEIDKETKITRGGKVVTFAEAKIAKGESIVVVVNTDDDMGSLATELRLSAK